MPASPELRKAAILLASLPEELAGQLMSRLSPKQVEVVSIEIAKLGRMTAEEQHATIVDFANSNPATLGTQVGGLETVKSLVQRALGDNAATTLDNVRQSIQAMPFGFLKQVDPQNLLTFVVDEHPQTIALILSHLPAAYGAEIVKGLPAEKQLAVVRRIANMGQTSPEVLQEVERGLEHRMANVMGQSYEKAGGVNSVAQILNVADRATERTLLENLAQDDPDLVEQIRRLMFVFEDLQKLSDKDIQAVMKNVETSQWAMALKGASPELKQRIMGNLSQRAAVLLTEEIDFLGAVRASDVEKVQQQIVDVVRRLEDAGEITVHAAEQEEAMVS